MEHSWDEQLRSGDFTTGRRSPCIEDADFIADQRRRGRPWPAIARMLGRPVEDVKAAFAAHQEARTPKRRRRVTPQPAAPQAKGRSKIVRPRPMPDRVAAIAREIADIYGCVLADLSGQRGCDTISLARQAAYYAVRAVQDEPGKPRFSYAAIGAFFGGRDHSTVLYGVKAHAARLAAGLRDRLAA